MLKTSENSSYSRNTVEIWFMENEQIMYEPKRTKTPKNINQDIILENHPVTV